MFCFKENVPQALKIQMSHRVRSPASPEDLEVPAAWGWHPCKAVGWSPLVPWFPPCLNHMELWNRAVGEHSGEGWHQREGGQPLGTPNLSVGGLYCTWTFIRMHKHMCVFMFVYVCAYPSICHLSTYPADKTGRSGASLGTWAQVCGPPG